MSLDFFLSFPDHRVEPSLGMCNWSVWIDPKTYEITEDSNNAVRIDFKGENTIYVAGLATLCYLTHPDSNLESAKQLASSMHYLHNYASLNDKKKIDLEVIHLCKRLLQDQYIRPHAKKIAKQIPSFIESSLWYPTILSAPGYQVKKWHEAQMKRRPETYKKLDEQAYKLHKALKMTLELMKIIKEELPELPDVPIFEVS
jgi:hypothetical protein